MRDDIEAAELAASARWLDGIPARNRRMLAEYRQHLAAGMDERRASVRVAAAHRLGKGGARFVRDLAAAAARDE